MKRLSEMAEWLGKVATGEIQASPEEIAAVRDQLADKARRSPLSEYNALAASVRKARQTAPVVKLKAPPASAGEIAEILRIQAERAESDSTRAILAALRKKDDEAIQ